MIVYVFLGLALLSAATSFPQTDNAGINWLSLVFGKQGVSEQEMGEKVTFWLETRQTLYHEVSSRITDRTIFNGRMDTTKPTKITIHGYLSHKDMGFTKKMREALLEAGDYNVISVDWSEDSTGMYNNVRDDVPEVGKVVAKFIDRLVDELHLPRENLHVIGHSLGAHISGVVGRNVKRRLARITGLDPAGPLFSYNDNERLMPQSAEFVDVIHTCGNSLGFFGDLGHVDFYPNGGTPGQPGCAPSMGVCSHGRAIDYYIESLTEPNAFIGKKCDNWLSYMLGLCNNNPTAVMGENVSKSARGTYWLKTGNSSPFGLGNDS